jgi:SAM-dependent methyltransferase
MNVGRSEVDLEKPKGVRQLAEPKIVAYATREFRHEPWCQNRIVREGADGMSTTPQSDQPTVDDVKRFWDASPLWTGESQDQPGSEAFFKSHTDACLAMTGGKLSPKFEPRCDLHDPVLDLGCGIGFWLEHFWRSGFRNITGADLSKKSLELAARRCELQQADVTLSLQNAEAMTFPDRAFRHVNCIGVIHHSPNPEKSVAEIARVLDERGTAAISVYYWNTSLRLWPVIRGVGVLLQRLGIRMSGRGRENMMGEASARELVRLYDGDENPVGLAFSKREFRALLEPHFEIEDFIWHAFPSRILPFRIPLALFRIVEWCNPFMICAIVRKRNVQS